nr:aminopeptidase N [Succinivibrionaceae bacterium]
MEKKNYKAARRLDYTAPEFTATTTEMVFELADDATVVKTNTRYKRLTTNSKTPLRLVGEDLELVSVTIDGFSCKYKEEAGKLIVENVPDEFELQIENIISPIRNSELMGLYKSNGVFCTQCEPEGFRRITYALDRPDVLTKYKVTIFAPEYGCSVMLSNGNLIEQGKKNGRHYTVWEDPFPKPSYLFALVAGTFDILEDTYTTRSGRKVNLQLYVDRGYYDRGKWAMESIKEAMRWDEDRFSLEYDLDNFKVVAVDFFNQGAMENKSLNIFNSIYVLVDKESATDSAFFNVQSVIGHEYFHNYTGDRVTLRDWFQLSLKESLT